MKKILLLAITILIGLSGSITTTHAADQFTFTIQYNAQSLMPEASGLEFNCYVFLKIPTSPSVWWSEAAGTGKKVVPVDPTTGNASGTVQIGVNTKPGFSPIDMKYYGCVVYLSSGGSTWGLDYNSPMINQKAKPGTPLVTYQEGWLPGKGP